MLITALSRYFPENKVPAYAFRFVSRSRCGLLARNSHQVSTATRAKVALTLRCGRARRLASSTYCQVRLAYSRLCSPATAALARRLVTKPGEKCGLLPPFYSCSENINPRSIRNRSQGDFCCSPSSGLIDTKGMSFSRTSRLKLARSLRSTSFNLAR